MTSASRPGPGTFLSQQKVMQLAVCADGVPWCASLYYAHRRNRFYFLSDVQARHAPATAGERRRSSAAIARDADDFRSICGAQLSGEVFRTRRPVERAYGLALYFRKFRKALCRLPPSFLGSVLQPGRQSGIAMFCFLSASLVWTDNACGIGSAFRRVFTANAEGDFVETASPVSPLPKKAGKMNWGSPCPKELT